MGPWVRGRVRLCVCVPAAAVIIIDKERIVEEVSSNKSLIHTASIEVRMTGLHAGERERECVCVCVCVHLCVHVHAPACTCLYVYIYVYMYICIYVRVCLCVRVFA